MSEIECLKFTPKSSGALQGFADIYVPKWGVEIFGVSIFMKDGRRWVSMPSREYDQDGVKKYWPYLKFREKAHMDAFSKKVMEAVTKFAETQVVEKPFVEDEDIPF